MKKKVAIFGGSFNPPHIGHRELIEFIRDSFSCDEIWLMPSGDRRDKTIEINSEHRLEMARIFAKKIQKDFGLKIVVSTHEVEKINKTATIETLQELSLMYPEHEFHLIVSSELVPMIKKIWVRGEELWTVANFILIERPGSLKLNEIELPPHSTILISATPFPDISSTQARQISDEKILRDLVDANIAEYIIKNKIYGFKENK